MHTQHLKAGEWIEREERLIASRLFKVRTQLGIEREDLAAMVGVDDHELRDFEFGITPVPASTLLMLALAMGIEIQYFFGSPLQLCNTANVSLLHGKKSPVMLS